VAVAGASWLNVQQPTPDHCQEALVTTSSTPLRLAVITGSTREGRFGPRLTAWFADIARAHGVFEVEVIDLADHGFPGQLGAGHPKQGEYSDEIAAFAQRIARADAFVFVTPEYNHGYPASLKAAIDSIYPEWAAKPAAFVAYGGASGGLRAVEQLRQVLAELHVMDIRESLALPRAQWTFFDEEGEPRDAAIEVVAKGLLGQLAWWAHTLRAGREASPYEL
jgi:NAD(P)H-dependent FMN reductase